MNLVRTIRSLFDSKAGDRIDELLHSLDELKESFDRGVGVQVMKQVLSDGEWFLRMCPAHI